MRRFLPIVVACGLAVSTCSLVRRALQPHHDWAEQVTAQPVTAAAEHAQVDLGLFSPQRQVEIFRRAWQATLGPRLTKLELL